MKVVSLSFRATSILAITCLMLACTKPDASANQATASPVASNITAKAVFTSSPPALPAQNPEDKMPRIKVDEAKKLVDEGKAIIIDVRGTDSYKMSHIAGSLDYPLNKIESGDYKGLPKDKRIIAYCT